MFVNHRDLDKENQQNAMVVSQVNVTLASMQQSHGNLNVNTEDLVDVGNLVYSYDLPSDAKNELRPKNDSSESEENDEMYETAENSLMKESSLFQNEMSRQYNRPKQTRSPRSIRNANDWAQRSSGYLQPKPTLNNAPESPMHFYSIGNKGHSIQNSEEFNAQNAIHEIVSEIVEDLQDPNELLKKQTLRKFNILAKVIRTMNSQQIHESTNRIMKDNESENQQEQEQKATKARKVYRDALVSAGTGPAVSEIMRLIEQQKIRGEEAAELVAQFPRNLRLPSEEMQKRFFVSSHRFVLLVCRFQSLNQILNPFIFIVSPKTHFRNSLSMTQSKSKKTWTQPLALHSHRTCSGLKLSKKWPTTTIQSKATNNWPITTANL